MTGWLGGGAANVKTSAPVIGSIRIQTSAYGNAVTLAYGKCRIAPNLIDYADFTAISHTEKHGGGKGGGGSVSNTTYTYTTAALMALCEGPITGITKAWADKSETTLAALGLTAFLGTYTQDEFGYWSTYHSAEALAYRGQAYVATGSYDLGGDASLPNHTFEVEGLLPFSPTIRDAVPSAVLVDFLTNSFYGAAPSIQIGDMTAFFTYCVAAGLFVSPAYTSQKSAQEAALNLAQIANTALFSSEGKLKAVPYGDTVITGNGVTFTPNTTPAYNLTLDDFLANADEAPVRITRNTNADAFNQVQVKFYNRANQYNEEIAEAKDQANIELFGLRPMDPVEMYEICDATVARNVAQLLLQRSLYIRNTYEFRLGWKYALLEPMDLLTLTEPNLGMASLPVRVIKIDEDEEGTLSFTTEDYLGGIASAPLYPSQSGGGYAANYQVDPGDSNVPIIFEPPENLTESATEVWVLASGGALWGGANIWVSADGTTYSPMSTINAPARQGVLSALLATGTDPDTTHTLSVDMSLSGLQVLSGSQTDADQFNTLCYVDGELIAYRDSTLVSANHYDLQYLRRGVYNSPIGAHSSGTQFCRLDLGAVARFPFDITRIGTTLFIKLQSFNIYGGGLQELADVPEYSYTITGTALNSPPHDVANLHTNYVAGLTKLYWDAVQDFRVVEYEVRTGPTWLTGTVLGRVSEPEFVVPGNATYWVATRVMGANGSSVYSPTPVSSSVTGATLTSNVIATFDEAATGWTGTLTGGATVTGGTTLQLNYSGDVSTVADISTLPDLGAFGDVQPSGEYTFPSGHTVTLAAVASCNVQISYAVTAFVTGVGTVDDPGPDVDVLPQIALSQDGTTWGAWQNYKPGVFTFMAVKARVLLASRNVTVTPQVTGLTFLVDVPDKTDSGHIATSAGGTVAYTYGTKFNGGNDLSGGGLGLPVLQVTINNAAAGDDVRITSKTTTGFSVDVVNGGARQVKQLDIVAQGY